MAHQQKSHDEIPVRLFQNAFLERLTQVSFQTFISVWSVVLAVVLIVDARHSHSAGSFILDTGIGLAIWFVMEYLLHRFLFHLRLRSDMGQKLIFLIHGNHHLQPNHPLRNLMPLSVSVPLGAAVWGIGVLTGGMATGGSIAGGFILGYVGYDIVHYACHQFPMKLSVLRAIKKHHIQHHCVEPEANFAITAIFLDRVFGTKLRRGQ
ncbi:fatty acid hydroxylase [Komagataeibacter melaceti]|uniref:Fatty acid hydroxylase n=1 Tax=Komagataeibacter melaceti TaxID=2766577 RepID=A0A371YYS1_9PROT|nr:sterol desaturase family protein [Komagataeibacter melaceti]RFD19385.1 fatty acid hydroxylase [Komagataeibacter melaceti]